MWGWKDKDNRVSVYKKHRHITCSAGIHRLFILSGLNYIYCKNHIGKSNIFYVKGISRLPGKKNNI